MASGERGVILRHGTTRRRAEAILRDGPRVDFREPAGFDPAEGFSMSPPEGPFPLGKPEDYATRKASLFPEEGGAVILEVEIPADIAALGDTEGGDVRFLPGWGLGELRAAWPTLERRVLDV